jgi:hypothetical protein
MGSMATKTATRTATKTLWTLLALALLVTGLPARARAQAGDPDATGTARYAQTARTLLPGRRIGVVEPDGTVTTGIVERAAPDALTLTTADGRRVTIPASRVARIIEKDSTRNGAFIGMAIGAGGGLAGGLLFNTLCRNEGANCDMGVLLLTGLGAAIGAGVGAAADALHQGTVFSSAVGAPHEFTPEVAAGIAPTWYRFETGEQLAAPGVLTASWSDLRAKGPGVEILATRALPGQPRQAMPCVTSDSPLLQESERGNCLGAGYGVVTNASSIGGKFVYTLGGRRVHPYVAAGLEVQRLQISTPEIRFIPFSEPDIFQRTSTRTDLVALVGGGVRVSIRNHLSIRPDLTAALSGGDWNAARISVALGYQW